MMREESGVTPEGKEVRQGTRGSPTGHPVIPHIGAFWFR